jgi:Amt family ammonium transporter
LNWAEIKQQIGQKSFRRHFCIALAGKMLGVLLLLAVIAGVSTAFLGGGAHAAESAPTLVDIAKTQADTINAVNTVWTLIAAFLVFFMQAGFMALEAGFARTKESVNIVVEGIVDTCLCGLLFWAFGFAFMFGGGNGFIGLGHDIVSPNPNHLTFNYFFLSNTPETWWGTGVPLIAFWLFQLAFADTCSTITSGAMLGRTGFVGDLLYSVGVSGFIYPIVGHWAWGPDGWLVAKGFLDFAGSTVVHTIGGFIALSGAIALGPRLGRVFKRDGGGLPPGHDLILASIGGIILWFGWFGFNPGSTLGALDAQGIGRVATNTMLAACAGGLTSLLYAFPRGKKWDCGIMVNGFLAGLVAITCPCYWVSPTGAVILGGIAGCIVVMAIDFVEWLRVDDPVGAVAVHGACGIWGTLSLGLFACGAYGVTGATGADNSKPIAGLFYGGGTGQLVSQLIGSASITAATFVGAMILMYAVKSTGLLRVSLHGEEEGIDYHEHGATAYPEFPVHSLAGRGVLHEPAPAAAVAAATPVLQQEVSPT